MSRRTHTHSAERLDTLVCRSLYDSECTRQIKRDALWSHISARAMNNRLGAVLLDALERRQVAMPEFPAMELRNYRDHLRARNDYQLSRVIPILKCLGDAQVPFLLLKGAALSALLSAQGYVRDMNDIDVLIHPKDADRADAVLLEAGCRRGEDLVQDDFYPRYYYEREYLTPGVPPVKIDLHVRPFRPLRYAHSVPDNALWDEPMQTAINGVPVWVPNAANMLIHLGVHAACHGLVHVRWLHDIRSWWQHFGDQIDVRETAAKCRQWRVAWPMYRALSRTAEVFDVPSDIKMLIRALSGCSNWRDRLALWQAPHDVDRPLTALLVNLATTPGWAFRLGYARAVLLPSEGHLRQLYPYRHPGWHMAAHAVRLWAAVRRCFTPQSEADD